MREERDRNQRNERKEAAEEHDFADRRRLREPDGDVHQRECDRGAQLQYNAKRPMLQRRHEERESDKPRNRF